MLEHRDVEFRVFRFIFVVVVVAVLVTRVFVLLGSLARSAQFQEIMMNIIILVAENMV